MSSGSGLRENRKIKVAFLAYREWALNVIEKLEKTAPIDIVYVIQSKEEYESRLCEMEADGIDCIVLLGWSWIIKSDILDHFLVVGMHPSDLPFYRGGSPIQHQIIDGILQTRISLMTISPDGIDRGDIWCKETWDLSGQNMSIILGELEKSCVSLFSYFFDNFGRIYPKKQDERKATLYKRRTPIDSKTDWTELEKMRLVDVYNKIRALGDPYPNLYIEDEEGNRLLFKEVEYKENDNRK